MLICHRFVPTLVMLVATALCVVPLQAQDAPRVTPMTIRPSLLNASEVSEALSREYPAVLRDAEIGGAPQVWLHIDVAGVVDAAEVAETSGFEALDQAALNVARVMRFSPAQNGAETTAVWIRIPIRFQVRRSERRGHRATSAAGAVPDAGRPSPMRFTPARNRDQRVPVWIEIPIGFQVPR